ncbi:molybdate ABC transporter substrate-binding protein [Sphingomonas donggukensis]|uniref:Molybdate ABC transporter substrate-binding protein n=1 Tax=Sphingomonas donggukensis TaxID=2949093 RepID=A0ABY4TRI5_9SPHN|nr:molybdate ABC transporter substrate-binding protein [Sphingomonas donggukensis]URW74559.1 molybdate ABC transporter substrate-binding protein [Sphingomonas donggukensis]
MTAMFRRLSMLAAMLVAIGAAPPPAEGPRVLAAASLQESMTAAAEAWARAGHPRPRVAFAASSALARQAMAGAPADLFVSADEAWMDVLERGGRVRAGTRANLLGNRLVLVAPAASRVAVRLGRGGNLAAVLGTGRLAMADPAAVPAGKYGQAALERLGDWRAVSGRVVRAENVRAALALVERGAAPLGVVYATDARASRAVRVVAVFPAASHPPIRYPIAILKGATSADAAPFRAFLMGPRGRAIFARYGFVVR